LKVREALSFGEDPKWLDKVATGGALVPLFCFLVPINFFVGYLTEVLRRTASGRGERLPEWQPWLSRFYDGAALGLLFTAHIFPLLILIAVGIVLLVTGNTGWGVAVLIAAGSYLLIWVQFWPAALVGFCTTSRWRAGLHPREILKTIMKAPISYQLLLWRGFALVLLALSGILLLLVGVLFTLPWAMIAYHRCVGDWARKAGLGAQL
jgi:hypothetical protein